MSLPPENPGVVGDAHRFLVTDRAGAEHDLGPLVNQLLTIRRQRQTGAGEELTRPTRDVFVGVETGIRIAVSTLFGQEAEEAFAAHCDEVERFLRDSDGVRQ